MARTESGRLLTEWHRRQQLRLRAAVVRDVMRFWPAWQPKDAATFKAVEDAYVRLIDARSQQSAALSARYYELFRSVDAPGNPAPMTVAMAAARPEAELRAAISATARAGVYKALAAGQSYDMAMANGAVKVAGAVSREVLNSGRDTIIGAADSDPHAEGWIRETSGDPCAFCAMLASRGPVYREETVDFQAHDHCSCFAEPVYAGSEWPGRGREFEEMWQQTGSLNGLRRMMSGKTTW